MTQSPFFKKLSRHFTDKVRQGVISHHKRSGKVLFSDTTLRDGEQMPGATLEPQEKLRIALANAGADAFPRCRISGQFSSGRRPDSNDDWRCHTPCTDALCRTLRADIDVANYALQGNPPHKRRESVLRHQSAASYAQIPSQPQ